jgi:O-antigen biosynthesis protein
MKFLILTYALQEYTGSEINAMQLAVGLRQLGHSADIGTFIYGNPLKRMIAEHGIRVIDLFSAAGSRLEYDVIWGHHWPTLAQVLNHFDVADCRIICSSLSSFLPLESPPLFHPSLPLMLAHNERLISVMQSNGVDDSTLYLFPNFAPAEMFEQARILPPEKLSRILVVSNHPPAEVRQAARLLREHGIRVDMIGEHDHPCYVDEGVLLQYDLVISLGKTAAYCFALKVPYFCYDHFGGPGYIHAGNFDLAYRHNFSGRCTYRKLAAEELAAEIMGGYVAAQTGVDFLFQQARTRMHLEDNLARLLERIQTTPIIHPADLVQKYPLVMQSYESYLDLLKRYLLLKRTIPAWVFALRKRLIGWRQRRLTS